MLARTAWRLAARPNPKVAPRLAPPCRHPFPARGGDKGRKRSPWPPTRFAPECQTDRRYMSTDIAMAPERLRLRNALIAAFGAREETRRAKSAAGQRGDPSELDAQARGRSDVLGRLVAVGETGVDVRNHNAGVKVDPLDRPIVHHKGNGVLGSCAGAVVHA